MIIESRPVKLTTRTGIEVRRTLPHRELKMIGPWCFIDHFGPTPQTDGMVVAAHPHTGLQTVTWLLEGAIEHRDSIGSVQRIEPGQLNLMTAGHGISHSELSLRGPENLHAVQLWVALPKAAIDVAPAFEHQANLPRVSGDGFVATVLAGTFMGHRADTKTFSPMVGVELRVESGKTVTIALDADFEYGLQVVEGSTQVTQGGDSIDSEAALVNRSDLFVTDSGQCQISITAIDGDLVALLLGGAPFGEKILMWWNFIARTQAEITEQREEWNQHLETEAGLSRFGSFEDQIGGWIPAPELPNVQLSAR